MNAPMGDSCGVEDAVRRLRALLGNSCAVVGVRSADDAAVAPYRMKKVRNHDVSSQQKREMLDRGEHWVVAMTSKVVHRALRGRHAVLSVLLACDSETLDFLIPVLSQGAVRDSVFVATKATVDAIVGITFNRGLASAALVNIPQHALFPSLSEDAAPGSPEGTAPLHSGCCPLLVLDDVRSADNVGSILRTAFSLGISSLLCSSTTFQAINARSARVSLGALFHFSIWHTSDVAAALLQLGRQGITVIGTSPTAKRAICSLDLLTGAADTSAWALVFGNEDKGLTVPAQEACAHVVTIPQTSGDSLSVVSAAAICIYELRRPCLRSAHEQGCIFTPDLP